MGRFFGSGISLGKEVGALAGKALAKEVGAVADMIGTLADEVAALVDEVAALADEVAALADEVAALDEEEGCVADCLFLRAKAQLRLQRERSSPVKDPSTPAGITNLGMDDRDGTRGAGRGVGVGDCEA